MRVVRWWIAKDVLCGSQKERTIGFQGAQLFTSGQNGPMDFQRSPPFTSGLANQRVRFKRASFPGTRRARLLIHD